MSRRSTRITAAAAAAANENMGMSSTQSNALPNLSATASNSGQYLQNYYGHPVNTRLLIGNLSQTGGKRHGGAAYGRVMPKPPKPPEKPLIPYMRYSRKVWEDVRSNRIKNQDLKLWEVGKIIGQMWKDLPSTERQQYVEEYEIAKIEHVELLKAYQTSPEYQAYLHAKSRAEAIMSATEGLAGDKDDAYMSIEPIDETVEDSDMCYSVKHVAAARFQRNHRLINDILGEAVHVPSTRAVVTTQRLNVLKNQVQSLEVHQKKLETELVHLEEAHETRKRKWIDQAKDFGKEMKRLRGITPQEYYKEYKQKQQNAAEKQKQIEEARKKSIAKEKEAEAETMEKGKSDKVAESEKKDAGNDESTEEKEENETMKASSSDSKTESSSAEVEQNKEENMEVDESYTKENAENVEEKSVSENSQINTDVKDSENVAQESVEKSEEKSKLESKESKSND